MKWWVWLLVLVFLSSPVLASDGFSLTITPNNPTTEDELNFKLTYENLNLDSPVAAIVLKYRHSSIVGSDER